MIKAATTHAAEQFCETRKIEPYEAYPYDGNMASGFIRVKTKSNINTPILTWFKENPLPPWPTGTLVAIEGADL